MKHLHYVRNKVVEFFIVTQIALCLIGLVAVAGYPIQAMLLAALAALYTLITAVLILKELNEIIQ